MFCEEIGNMNDLLTTMKEVQEGGKRIANHYLSYGYILLDIQSGARSRKFPEPNRSGQQYYVHRNPVYVLGRPDGVEPAPPMQEQEPKQDKVEES
jgi:hypothetical protein